MVEVANCVGVVVLIPVLPKALFSNTPNNTTPSKELDIVIGKYIAAFLSLNTPLKLGVWSKKVSKVDSTEIMDQPLAASLVVINHWSRSLSQRPETTTRSVAVPLSAALFSPGPAFKTMELFVALGGAL